VDIYKIKRWQTTKTLPQLGPDATHIWRIDLDLASNGIKYPLSDSELERSERFISDRDRNRFIQGRGGMRSILGNYLGMPGQQLQIDIAKQGKPFLTHPGTNLQFNLTHTAGMALLAVTLDTAIGIDMEQIRDRTGYMRIAKRIFADSIYNHLVSLPESDRHFAFLFHWTS